MTTPCPCGWLACPLTEPDGPEMDDEDDSDDEGDPDEGDSEPGDVMYFPGRDE